MRDLSERVSMLEQVVGRFSGIGDGDEEFPYLAAIRIRTQLQSSLVSAVHLVAQLKLGAHDEGGGRLVSEIIDDWCPTGIRHSLPPRPPRPRWGSILEQLAILADGYTPGSALHDASLELCARIVSHVREQNKAAR